jgi:hypothetical protein
MGSIINNLVDISELICNVVFNSILLKNKIWRDFLFYF